MLIYVVALGIQNYERLRKTVYWGCIAALGVELIYMELFYTSTKLRALGTFNNPNQLGYWSLLMMACLGVALWGRRLRVLDIVALLTAAYCIAHSLSKAAMFAGALMLLVTVFSCRWHRKAVLATVALALSPAVSNWCVAESPNGLRARTSSPAFSCAWALLGNSKTNTLWERGYSRLVLHPQYLAFGAGEGAFIRLSDEENDKEFHSTLGNVLMSYGVIGLSFLLSLFFVVFRRATLSSMCLFLPLMLYGITHMGLRNTMLWVFLELVLPMASQCGREWRRRRGHPSCKGSHIWLQAHLRERGPDLVLIDGVHDNNVVAGLIPCSASGLTISWPLPAKNLPCLCGLMSTTAATSFVTPERC